MCAKAIVRGAETGDSRRIAEILVSAELVKDDGGLARVEECLRRSRDTCFVSEEGGILNGVALASFNGFHLFLSHIAVTPECRGMGVASALHERLVARARELGAKGIIADSWLSSTGFYYKLGYRMPGAVFVIKNL